MTANSLLDNAQHVVDSITIANKFGDEFNAVGSLIQTFNSYSRLYERLTGKKLIVVNGRVEEVTA